MAGVPIPSTRGSSSRLLSSADVRCLTPLGPLTPRSHPLTFLYMFRTNVLDLTRDNRASIPDLSFLSSCFRLPGPIFFCYCEPKIATYVTITCRHSQQTHSTDRPPVCLSHALLPHPKGRPLIPFSRFSVVAFVSFVTCSGAHPDPPFPLFWLLDV